MLDPTALLTRRKLLQFTGGGYLGLTLGGLWRAQAARPLVPAAPARRIRASILLFSSGRQPRPNRPGARRPRPRRVRAPAAVQPQPRQRRRPPAPRHGEGRPLRVAAVPLPQRPVGALPGWGLPRRRLRPAAHRGRPYRL